MAKFNNIEELAKLLGKEHRIKILLKLYPDKEIYITELADALDIDRRNLGRYLEELQEKKLIRFREEQRSEGGKPYRYYNLTDSGKKIVTSFIEVTTEDKELRPEKWQIDKLVQLLRDPTLNTSFLKVVAANKFFNICTKDPIYVTENEKVQKIFEDTIEKPTQFIDRILKRLRDCISTSFSRLLINNDRGEWVLIKLYPELVRSLEDKTKDEELRKWALNRIGDVSRSSPIIQIQKEAIEKIFKIYFSEVNYNSKLGEAAKQELIWVLSKELYEVVLEKTKSSDEFEKIKAEKLLEEMIKNFDYKESVKIYV